MTFDIMDHGQVILEADAVSYEEWLSKAFSERRKNFSDDLYCYSPTGYPYKIPAHQHTNPHNFASLSVTGSSCSLHCEHCDAKLLRGMQGTPTPEELLKACEKVKERGGDGVLISGGSDSQGHVPLDRFTDVIRTVKQELGLQVVVHTGLVSEEIATALGIAGIDAAMLDIIGDADLARRVYHLENGPQKMAKSLDLLKENGIPIAPHVLVGLNYGNLTGEIEALKMIAARNPEAVVIIALNPLRGTPMESISPPTPDAIGRVMTIARLGMPHTPLLLGCARPIGDHKIKTDVLAIKAGINGVAYISQEGVDLAEAMQLRVVFKDICCSLAPIDLSKHSGG
ncbi:MAG: radical SAM protein [Candidatus Thorarchaeota archaeon]